MHPCIFSILTYLSLFCFFSARYGPEIMEATYPGMVIEAEKGYDFAIGFDIDAVPAEEREALLFKVWMVLLPRTYTFMRCCRGMSISLSSLSETHTCLEYTCSKPYTPFSSPSVLSCLSLRPFWPTCAQGLVDAAPRAGGTHHQSPTGGESRYRGQPSLYGPRDSPHGGAVREARQRPLHHRLGPQLPRRNRQRHRESNAPAICQRIVQGMCVRVWAYLTFFQVFPYLFLSSLFSHFPAFSFSI